MFHKTYQSLTVRRGHSILLEGDSLCDHRIGLNRQQSVHLLPTAVSDGTSTRNTYFGLLCVTPVWQAFPGRSSTVRVPGPRGYGHLVTYSQESNMSQESDQRAD